MFNKLDAHSIRFNSNIMKGYNTMKVRNMKSISGSTIKNQFILEHGQNEYFQSYETIIAMRDKISGLIYLDAKMWDYSVTTGKYRNQFLGMDKKTTEKAINNKEIILTDLNA